MSGLVCAKPVAWSGRRASQKGSLHIFIIFLPYCGIVVVYVGPRSCEIGESGSGGTGFAHRCVRVGVLLLYASHHPKFTPPPGIYKSIPSLSTARCDERRCCDVRVIIDCRVLCSSFSCSSLLSVFCRRWRNAGTPCVNAEPTLPLRCASAASAARRRNAQHPAATTTPTSVWLFAQYARIRHFPQTPSRADRAEHRKGCIFSCGTTSFCSDVRNVCLSACVCENVDE